MKLKVKFFILSIILSSFSLTGQVDLPQVSVICGNATTTSIEISWIPLQNAAEYIVIAKQFSDTLKIDTTQSAHFEVTDLDVSGPRSVEFEVTAVGNPGYNNSVATYVCNKVSCPIIPIHIDPIEDFFCKGDSARRLLTYTADFSNVPADWGIGIYNFSGAGISPVGILDFRDLPVGQHEVTVSYTEQSCVYSNTIEFSIVEPQTLTPVCETDPNSENISISWNNAGLNGYDIWANGNRIGSSSDTTFTFFPDSSETAYNFWIVGFKGDCMFPSDTTTCISSVVSISSIEKNAFLKIAPNPSSGVFNIMGLLPIDEAEIFSPSGKSILKSNQTQLDLGHLPKGIYFVSVNMKHQRIIRRIVLL